MHTIQLSMDGFTGLQLLCEYATLLSLIYCDIRYIFLHCRVMWFPIAYTISLLCYYDITSTHKYSDLVVIIKSTAVEGTAG